MGTRSLTYVYDGDTPIVCMYRQFDGYPTGHGAELAEFLSEGKIVNGLGSDNGKVFNGMGCLAAQMIAHFKQTPGGFYIHAIDLDQDSWQDYEYHLYDNKVKITTAMQENIIFEGTWVEFDDYCSVERYEEAE
jgi:hypothetical protein